MLGGAIVGGHKCGRFERSEDAKKQCLEGVMVGGSEDAKAQNWEAVMVEGHK